MLETNDTQAFRSIALDPNCKDSVLMDLCSSSSVIFASCRRSCKAVLLESVEAPRSNLCYSNLTKRIDVPKAINYMERLVRFAGRQQRSLT